MNGKILVVPLAAPLPPNLLATNIGIKPCAAPDTLVVGQERGEASKRADCVEADWIIEIPLANFEHVEQFVEVTDQICGSVRTD